MAQDQRPLSGLKEVRWSIRLLFAFSFLAAMLMPLLTLWHAAHSPIRANVCVSPTDPQTPTTAQVLVTLPNAADRSAVSGPWATLQAVWDMTTMSMGNPPLVVNGTDKHTGTFIVPLRVNMPGSWWVTLTLHTPGRPLWQKHFLFTVASPDSPGQMFVVQQAGISPCPLSYD
jgi:hypothetical protein